MLTIRPAPRSRRCGPTARIPRNGPRRFVASTSSHSSGSIAKRSRTTVRAAPLTRAPRSPASWAAATARAHDVGLAHVHRDRRPRRSRARRRARDRVAVEVGEDDRPALAVQPARDRGADPPAGAGDDRDRHSSRLAPIAPPRSPSSASRNSGGSRKNVCSFAAASIRASQSGAEPLAEAAADDHRLDVEQRHGRADPDPERLDGALDQLLRDLVARLQRAQPDAARQPVAPALLHQLEQHRRALLGELARPLLERAPAGVGLDASLEPTVAPAAAGLRADVADLAGRATAR